MDKPGEDTRTEVFYSWNKCVEYLEEKHSMKIRDYAGHFGEPRNYDAPYQDYWHFVYEYYEFNRNSFFYMDNDLLDPYDGIEDWQKEITEMFLSEFGKGDNRQIRFWVSW